MDRAAVSMINVVVADGTAIDVVVVYAAYVDVVVVNRARVKGCAINVMVVDGARVDVWSSTGLASTCGRRRGCRTRRLRVVIGSSARG